MIEPISITILVGVFANIFITAWTHVRKSSCTNRCCPCEIIFQDKVPPVSSRSPESL